MKTTFVVVCCNASSFRHSSQTKLFFLSFLLSSTISWKQCGWTSFSTRLASSSHQKCLMTLSWLVKKSFIIPLILFHEENDYLINYDFYFLIFFFLVHFLSYFFTFYYIFFFFNKSNFMLENDLALLVSQRRFEDETPGVTRHTSLPKTKTPFKENNNKTNRRKGTV